MECKYDKNKFVRYLLKNLSYEIIPFKNESVENTILFCHILYYKS